MRVREPGARRGLTLAAAAERRPPKVREDESAQASQTLGLSLTADKSRVSGTAVPALCPVPPRLLDLAAAAAYLGLSPWTVRDLEGAGTLRRVRVPLPNGAELRKLLFDREDLDRLVEAWKEPLVGGPRPT